MALPTSMTLTGWDGPMAWGLPVAFVVVLLLTVCLIGRMH
ncbi:hypothetical protein GMO_27900 [Gluconobacter morbifer G707]|uniref:Uncharacterized protein n=1 Tax=Gluconobacter morbifer G707 TaxID=1088869 RepID=G6XMS2_9PROT|nr:hypothetical protein GMO_27900 [Gluconobacter morbifer G707]